MCGKFVVIYHHFTIILPSCFPRPSVLARIIALGHLGEVSQNYIINEISSAYQLKAGWEASQGLPRSSSSCGPKAFSQSLPSAGGSSEKPAAARERLQQLATLDCCSNFRFSPPMESKH